MNLTDWIVIGVIVLIVGGAIAYIVKAKKSGQKCIGCPHSAECSAKGGCKGKSSACSCREKSTD